MQGIQLRQREAVVHIGNTLGAWWSEGVMVLGPVVPPQRADIDGYLSLDVGSRLKY